eukprot:261997_1
MTTSLYIDAVAHIILGFTAFTVLIAMTIYHKIVLKEKLFEGLKLCVMYFVGSQFMLCITSISKIESRPGVGSAVWLLWRMIFVNHGISSLTLSIYLYYFYVDTYPITVSA